MYHTNILSVMKETLPRTLVYKVPKYMIDSKRIFYETTNNYHILSVKRNVSSSSECPWKKAYGSIATQSTNKNGDVFPRKRKLQHGPDLQYFIANKTLVPSQPVENVPYVQNVGGQGQKVFFDVYGCQMNVNDTAVIWSILKNSGYQIVSDFQQADIILLITCAIRDSAEVKVANMISKFSTYKNKRKVLGLQPVKIGVLGCMASRLKKKILLEHQYVDVVAGPDSYKDLPRLLAMTDRETAINVALSMDETYADVQPVRLNQDSVTAYVSIMRGCDNMCTYCIVPFTRGRERSRPISSIVSEIRSLSYLGVKEVTLLGQNVNSYRDISTSIFLDLPVSSDSEEPRRLARGFKTVYKNKKGGLRFGDLLDKVSAINPEMRIRFTSPHPKDFPDDVLQLISERANICKHLHVPAQSGNSAVLERMRRGYTREAYVELIDQIRSIIPNVTLSSDFIAGFCGETDEEFEDTLTLIREIKYNVAYLFAYSMREKTTAHRRFKDDVPQQVKIHRLQRMIAAYREEAEKLNKSQIGSYQLILVEGESKRSKEDLQGRTDGNIKVIIPKADINVEVGRSETRSINVGDYVVVQILDANSQILIGLPLYHSSITSYYCGREKYTCI